MMKMTDCKRRIEFEAMKQLTCSVVLHKLREVFVYLFFRKIVSLLSNDVCRPPALMFSSFLICSSIMPEHERFSTEITERPFHQSVNSLI